MTRTTDTTTTTDEGLVTAAARGDHRAFDELHRRHAPLAWRLALAITGRPEDAAAAVAEGTGTTFTAVRAGRFQAVAHPIALATATRNAALDLRRHQDAIGAPVAAEQADPFLATAFGALPERWRSVLWLRDAEDLDAEQTAAVVELTPEAVDQLAVRARRGLRERYQRAQVATCASRDCSRATSRLAALQDGTLGEADRATLERHLGTCEACTQRRTALAAIPTALPALAAEAPDDLAEAARAAWTAALATTSSTGLSPRTEKVLAGASAFAAAVGVLGAALFGTGGGGDPVASPLAPLVADIDAPKPIDLTSLALPVIDDPAPVPARPRSTVTGVAGAVRDTTGAIADEVTEAAAPANAPTTAPPTAPAPIAAETPASPGPADVPIDVNLGEDTSVDLGPIGVDLDPEEGEKPVRVEAPEPLAPVVDPVVGVVNTVVEPVTEVLDPVLEAAEPLTGGVGQVLGGLGR